MEAHFGHASSSFLGERSPHRNRHGRRAGVAGRYAHTLLIITRNRDRNDCAGPMSPLAVRAISWPRQPHRIDGEQHQKIPRRVFARKYSGRNLNLRRTPWKPHKYRSEPDVCSLRSVRYSCPSPRPGPAPGRARWPMRRRWCAPDAAPARTAQRLAVECDDFAARRGRSAAQSLAHALRPAREAFDKCARAERRESATVGVVPQDAAGQQNVMAKSGTFPPNEARRSQKFSRKKGR